MDDSLEVSGLKFAVSLQCKPVSFVTVLSSGFIIQNFSQGERGQEGDGDGQRHHRIGERRRGEHRPRVENDRYNETSLGKSNNQIEFV